MAEKKPARPDFVQTAAKSGKEARQAFEFDLNRRLNDQKKILSADDLSGLYDPKRALFTTVDGVPRMLTLDDLLAFRAAVRDMKNRHKGKQYQGGIKPKQVIDLSLPIDRDRAQKEIRQAAPVSNRGGAVHFQTNAGPNSDVQRHHVNVEFLNFNAAVASPADASKIVKEMLTGNVKFDCDCGRHTFWYRFIATIGGFNYGRAEDGYPRIKNPKLRGVACKHVLRVMSLINQSPTFKQYAVRMIEQGRKVLSTDKRSAVKVADMEKFAEQLRKENWRQRAVKTTDEKRAARAGMSVGAYQLQQSALKRVAPKAKAKAKAKAAGSKQTDAMMIKNMMTGLGFTEAQAKAALAAARAVQ